MHNNDIITNRYVFPICSKEQYSLFRKTALDKTPETHEEYEREIFKERETFFKDENASLVYFDVIEMSEYFKQKNLDNIDVNRRAYVHQLVSGRITASFEEVKDEKK